MGNSYSDKGFDIKDEDYNLKQNNLVSESSNQSLTNEEKLQQLIRIIQDTEKQIELKGLSRKLSK